MMALEGIKVLDRTQMGPGPYCTMFLGDLGADIIRVDPGGGRAAEARYPFQLGEEERMRAYDAEERNKRSIVLNLKTSEARRIYYQLATRADVILEQSRPGAAERLGVDYNTIKRKNSKIIYCAITGYGQTGPYRDIVGHDINYIAAGGALGIMGPNDSPPAIPSNLLADYAAGGMQAAIGIMAAIIARERTGKGQFVDISMLDGVISLMHVVASMYFINGQIPERGNDMLTGGMSFYNVYETKDGKYVSVASIESWFFQNLCSVLGREDLAAYQWSLDKKEEVISAFRDIFLTKTRDEWVKIMRLQDTCVAPVYSIDEVISDPQVMERDMVVEINHPSLGKVKQVGIPIKLSETPGAIRRLPPRRGEHTEEILLELGYNRQAIDELRSSEAIK
jgi:crotonobetainyl-CoA:carnitine CoA-transferase CaiB-like acyl-CoA transferase